jgi:hypothetical protein
MEKLEQQLLGGASVLLIRPLIPFFLRRSTMLPWFLHPTIGPWHFAKFAVAWMTTPPAAATHPLP